MSNFMYFTVIVALGGTVTVPTTRRNFEVDHFLSFALQAYADDPIGTTAVTFDGVIAGSEIRVYLPDGDGGSAGTEVAGLDSCVAQQQLTWPVYAGGSPNNTVWIHIIKRGLRWMKFPYASKPGAQSIPIFQNTDLGYNNPA